MSAPSRRPPAAPRADRGADLVDELDREDLWWRRFRLLTLVCAALAVAFGIVLSTSGCATAERPACAPETLGAIEAAYVAEAFAACRGYELATCPGLAEIETRYRAKREEWIRCR